MKIGIIGAMDAEVRTLAKKEMDAEQIVSKAGMTFHVGRIGDTDTVVVRSGVGKVNAALCAQILIDCFGVTHLINTGIAGSLDHDLNIGDIVVSTDAVQHDMDLIALGYEAGEIPVIGTDESLRVFPADPGLRAAAMDACREAVPGCGVVPGRVVSGDQFIGSVEQKHRIRGAFPDALCAEMEGAAIAHAAHINGIPFVILRAISDKADEEADVDFDAFQREAAENCARLAAHMVRSLS